MSGLYNHGLKSRFYRRCPAMRIPFLTIAATWLVCFAFAAHSAAAEPTSQPEHWLWSTAWHIPPETTSDESGYFALVEGHNGRVYIGAAKYGDNAFLVEFDPAAALSDHGKNAMRIVVDAEKEIGVDRKGFAAQAKFHTRGNVGESGQIYHGTKQGYPKEGEKTQRLSRRAPDRLRPGDGQVSRLRHPHSASRRDQHRARRIARRGVHFDLLGRAADREHAFHDSRSGDGQVPRPVAIAGTCTPSSSWTTSAGLITRSSAATSRATIRGRTSSSN